MVKKEAKEVIEKIDGKQQFDVSLSNNRKNFERREKMLRQLKFLLIGMACAAFVAGSATSSLAAIAGTPHDLQGTLTASLCEPCHIPHGGDETARLWAATKAPVGTGWLAAGMTVSQLCGSCHYGVPAYPLLVGVVHDMTDYSYAAGNHGSLNSALTTMGGEDDAATSGLPYGDQTNIQCSSCHNPHENAVRPFMRTLAGNTVQDLCLDCHTRDNTTGGSGSTNVGDTRLVTPASMHPVDIAYPGAATVDYDPNIIQPLNSALFANSRGTAGVGSISVSDALGGKLLGQDGTTGNMGCPTCHQVHGDGSTTSRYDWLLVNDNDINTNPTANAALCESCHNGGDATGSVLFNSNLDHPIDAVTGSARFTAANFA
ncbi:MAG: hypothetical protein GTO08_05690, partial [Deltaproteobacteria bacterium]|nr:hypothetical protein [Deltaproteobacteria bacterium]